MGLFDEEDSSRLHEGDLDSVVDHSLHRTSCDLQGLAPLNTCVGFDIGTHEHHVAEITGINITAGT